MISSRLKMYNMLWASKSTIKKKSDMQRGGGKKAKHETTLFGRVKELNKTMIQLF